MSKLHHDDDDHECHVLDTHGKDGVAFRFLETSAPNPIVDKDLAV